MTATAHQKQEQDASELAATLARLPELFPGIEVVYLFGSQATGDAGAESDIDVGLYTDDDMLAQDPLLDLRIAVYLESVCRRPVDVTIMNRANAVLQHEILRTGKRLRETDPEKRARRELIAFKEYLDHRHYQMKRAKAHRHG